MGDRPHKLLRYYGLGHSSSLTSANLELGFGTILKFSKHLYAMNCVKRSSSDKTGP